MTTVLIVLTCLVFGHVAWHDIRWGTYLLLAALPTYLIRFSIGPIPSTLLEVLLLIVLLTWAVKHKGLTSRNKALKIWKLPIALTIIAATIGVFVSPDTISAIGIWKAYFIEPILLFLFLVDQIKTKEQVKRVLVALGVGALGVSIFALFQAATGAGIPIPFDVERRVTSFYEFPNAVGLFLGPIVTIAIVFAARRRSWFWIAVATLGGLAIIASQTEAAWIAIPASLFIISLPPFQGGNKGGWWPKAMFPLALIVILLAFLIPSVQEKILLQDFSGTIRRTQWSETVELLKDNPLLGAGLSGYPIAIAPYHTSNFEPFQYPHNIFLNAWVELGLLGIVLLFVFARVIWKLTSHLSKGGLKGGWLPTELTTIAILAALIEITIHGLVDVPYFKNDLAILVWTLFALLTISSYEIRNRKDS